MVVRCCWPLFVVVCGCCVLCAVACRLLLVVLCCLFCDVNGASFSLFAVCRACFLLVDYCFLLCVVI